MLRMVSRSGFTLVEVVASIGIFAIAFLVGASAISTFMIKQEETFQRTVAASAAMLLVDCRYRDDSLKRVGLPANTATGPGLLAGDSTGMLKAADSSWYSMTRFKGGPKDIVGANDACFVFDRSGLTGVSRTSAGYKLVSGINIAEYKSLIVTISKGVSQEVRTTLPSSTTVPSPDGIDWRRMTFWYGYAPDVKDGKKTTVSFLGTYLYADGIRDP